MYDPYAILGAVFIIMLVAIAVGGYIMAKMVRRGYFQ